MVFRWGSTHSVWVIGIKMASYNINGSCMYVLKNDPIKMVWNVWNSRLLILIKKVDFRGLPLMIWGGGRRKNRKWIYFFRGNAFWVPEEGLPRFFFSISSGPPPRSLMVVPLVHIMRISDTPLWTGVMTFLRPFLVHCELWEQPPSPPSPPEKYWQWKVYFYICNCYELQPKAMNGIDRNLAYPLQLNNG